MIFLGNFNELIERYSDNPSILVPYDFNIYSDETALKVCNKIKNFYTGGADFDSVSGVKVRKEYTR